VQVTIINESVRLLLLKEKAATDIN